MSERRFFKHTARKILLSEWLPQIIAFLVVGAIYVGVNQFGGCLSSVIILVTGNESLSRVFAVVYFVFSFLLLVPLFYGVVKYEAGAVDNEKPRLSDLFFAFSSMENANRAYGMFLSVALKILLRFLPAIALWIFDSLFYYDGMFSRSLSFGNVDVINFVLKSVFLVFLYMGTVLSSKYYFAVYLSVMRPEFEPKDCFLLSKVCTHSMSHELAKITLGFIPIFVISLFSMGLLFILYTLPYVFLTYTVVCKYIYEKEMYTQQIQSLLYGQHNKEN